MHEQFSSLVDDYFVNLNLQTTLTLPNSRETVLHFCEAVQRDFPDMTSFYQRETGDFVLEGDRERGSYQWLELGAHRMTAGYFNPPDVDKAYDLHRWLLDRSVYFLGASPLDVEALDVLVGFNMDYRGNRDGIVADALLSGSPLGALVSDETVKPVECQPNLIIALDEECYLQARLNIETRSSEYQVRTGRYEVDPISVYFTVRRYPQPGKLIDLADAFIEQYETCEDLVARIVVPQVLMPIASEIASGR